MDNIQTLIFRTGSKTTTLYDSLLTKVPISEYSFDKVSTVAIREGFYEIMVTGRTKTIPVARLPIACTNMIITEE